MEAALLLKWSVVLALLTAIGAPLTTALFACLPRRGAAFSLPVTLAVLATVVFLLGQITFGLHTVVFGILVVWGFSALAYRAGYTPEWRTVASTYGVFLAGFLLFAFYVAHTTAITPQGGEQFLHYGLTNALVDTSTLPPEDFWFAGEPLRYYYGTQLQVATLSMLTGTELRYGYYLGLTTFYAVLFVSAYGLVGAVVENRGRSFHLGGLFGAVFVALAGTSVTFFRQLFGRLPDETAREYGEPVFRGLIEERGMSLEEAIASQGGTGDWLWFYERYAAEGGLHEFPFYSFIKADLHGHTLSTGYIVLAAAIAFSYYLTPAEQRYRRLGVLYGGLGLVAGVFGFMNTWALPTAVGLAWLALAAADPHPASLLPESVAESLVPETDGLRQRLPAEAWRVVLGAVLAVPVGIVGVAIASPFLVFGQVPTNEGIGLLPPRTSLDTFLVLYGGILALFAGYLGSRSRPLSALSSTHFAVGVALLVGLFVGLLASFAVTALLVAVLLVAWWLVRTDRAGFTAVLLVAGLGLLLALELVHAKVYPFDRVRWNTTLKVAVQGWTLAGLAAGGAAALLLSQGVERLRSVRQAVDDTELSRETALLRAIPAALAVLLVVALVATSLPFGILAIQTNADILSPDDGSLDGLAVHDTFKEAEMEGLYWLDDQGQPTIAESPTRRTYSWSSYASVFTGAATVVGWDHEEGYRGVAAFEQRASDIDALYTGPLTNATAIVDRYGIEYIYVGPTERENYDDINEFDQIAGISEAFSNEAVTIYAVDETRMP